MEVQRFAHDEYTIEAPDGVERFRGRRGIERLAHLGGWLRSREKRAMEAKDEVEWRHKETGAMMSEDARRTIEEMRRYLGLIPLT